MPLGSRWACQSFGIQDRAYQYKPISRLALVRYIFRTRSHSDSFKKGIWNFPWKSIRKRRAFGNETRALKKHQGGESPWTPTRQMEPKRGQYSTAKNFRNCLAISSNVSLKENQAFSSGKKKSTTRLLVRELNFARTHLILWSSSAMSLMCDVKVQTKMSLQGHATSCPKLETRCTAAGILTVHKPSAQLRASITYWQVWIFWNGFQAYSVYILPKKSPTFSSTIIEKAKYCISGPSARYSQEEEKGRNVRHLSAYGRALYI